MKRMFLFLGIVILPIIWMALIGSFSLANFAVGFLLSMICLWIISPPGETAVLTYLIHLYRLIGLTLFFFKELIIANLRVAYEVITKGFQMEPAIIAIPLDTRSDFSITVLANIITLTPGTLSLDVSPAKDTLYIHAMYVGDVDAFRQDIKARFEKRVMETFEL
jgi:multicomponent Na+:H+ antiporter subunit E